MSMLPNTVWLGKSFEYFDELDSTNTYLKEHAHSLPHGFAVIAGRQTKGRGRLGREWIQSDVDSLALSVLLHGADIKTVSALPLAMGLAAALALEELCKISIALKWSNDVLHENRKLCGILCESRLGGGKTFAVMGIGVNLSEDEQDFKRLKLVYATSLKLATGKSFKNFEVASKICEKLEPIVENIEKNGFQGIREQYKQYCVTLGKDIRVMCGDTKRQGRAIDIAMNGSLVCEIDGETVLINAGEASVRGIYGYV